MCVPILTPAFVAVPAVSGSAESMYILLRPPKTELSARQ